MRNLTPLLVLIAAFGSITATDAWAQSLRGSKSSLARQNAQAIRHDFTYLRDSQQLKRFVNARLLVPVRTSHDFRLKDVSFPFTRPEVKVFIERLSRQFRSACGGQLIVTSLTRPAANQPRNASPRSVHPTGMALDLRRPLNRPCRNWLEDTLLYLEGQAVLEATRERSPPHYHVALFPQDYAAYVYQIKSRNRQSTHLPGKLTHTVRRRDTLWNLSRRFGITTRDIQRANDLRSSVIHVGQELKIPVSVSVTQ